MSNPLAWYLVSSLSWKTVPSGDSERCGKACAPLEMNHQWWNV